jgi:hypothetical protein
MSAARQCDRVGNGIHALVRAAMQMTAPDHPDFFDTAWLPVTQDRS